MTDIYIISNIIEIISIIIKNMLKNITKKNKQTINTYRCSWAKNKRLKDKNKPMMEVKNEKTIIKFN